MVTFQAMKKNVEPQSGESLGPESNLGKLRTNEELAGCI